MEITQKEVNQLIETENPNTFGAHLRRFFLNEKGVAGTIASRETQIWQRNQWTFILYAVFTFKFDEKHHLIAIGTKLNIMGKILFFGIFSVLFFLFIPKDIVAYQDDRFWIYTCIKIIFLLLYLICGKVMYDSEKEVQKEAIFHQLDLEIDDKNDINEHSLYSYFLRFLTYPLGFATLYVCIFHFFPTQKYLHATFGMVVISAYFITDVLLIFKRKKK